VIVVTVCLAKENAPCLRCVSLARHVTCFARSERLRGTPRSVASPTATHFRARERSARVPMSCVVSRAASAAAAHASAPSSSRRAPRRATFGPPRGGRSSARLGGRSGRAAPPSALPGFLDGFANPFGGGGGSAAKRDAAKAALLAAIEGCDRGVTASDARKAHIDALASALERLTPNKKALRSELINGEWELLYTTSGSILGSNRPWPFRPIGPIYQTIDVERLRARNRETFPFFNAVDADVTPTSASGVDVQFVRFKIFGVVGVDAPASARGALDTTYLDSELRVGRGDKGNLFVLAMRDREARLESR